MKYKKILSAAMLLLCLCIFAMLVKAYFDGKFDSPETLREYISEWGVFAPFILVIIQAAQVVIPVLPGFLGCAAGAVMFGSIGGFLCNYIGISAGSVIAFFLAKKYGIGLVKSIFPADKYEKYAGWAANSKSYTALLFWAMVLPLFPDDFLCYFSGLTEMRAKKFITIIILGKPWCILVYSILFAKI